MKMMKMMKIINFQHTRKSKISGVPKTLRVFEAAENRRFSCIMKKGQQEIMGLSIVIVLIIIGILVIAKLNSFGIVSYKEDYERSELASSMLNTLLAATSRDCNELSMAQILQDCADNNANKCNGENSCAHFEQQSREIFKNTLELWKIDYEFGVFYEENNSIIKLGKQCVNKKSEIFPIPAESGMIFIKLDICR